MSTDVESETCVVLNIQSGIDQGRILRNQKSLSLRGKHAALIKQPKLAIDEINNKSKSKKNKRAHTNSPIVKTNRSLAVSGHVSSHQTRVSKPVFLYNSMRICELAAPSKRQCIESWRANASILPATMIDRLQKRIMDQEPIVKVSDVVTYSKHHKRPKIHNQDKAIIIENKRSTRRKNDGNKEARYKTVKTRRQDNQDFVAALEKKIAELLMKPMHITLNSELQKISSVVSNELYNIIKEKKIFRTDKATKHMLSEISEKVTIWIAKILEDTEERLLLEELKDLEEEEGPVLDILDDLLEDILHKCVRTPSVTSEFVSVSSGDTDSVDNDEESSKTGSSKGNVEDTIEDDMTKQINQLISSLKHDDFIEISSNDKIDETIALVGEKLEGSAPVDVKLQGPAQDDENLKSVEDDDDIAKQIDEPTFNHSFDPDHVTNRPEFLANNLPSAAETRDIHLIYNNMAFENENKVEDQNLSDARDLNELEATVDQVEQGIENNSTTLPLSEENAEIPTAHDQDLDDTNLKENNTLSHVTSVTSNMLKNLIVTNEDIEDQTSNVSAAIEVVTEELSEEKYTKVKFPKDSIDIIKEDEHRNNRDILQSDDELRKTANFNEPNYHLLSDADESWPVDINRVKPSASISKTTSMARILETDEKYSISLDGRTESVLYTERSHPKNVEDKDSPQTNENIDKGSDKQNEENSLQNKVKAHEASVEEKGVLSSENIEESLENADKQQMKKIKTLDQASENNVGSMKAYSFQNIQRTNEMNVEKNVERIDKYADGEKKGHSSQITHDKNGYDLAHKISKHFNQQMNKYNSIAELSTEPVQQNAIQIANKIVQDSGNNLTPKGDPPKMEHEQKDNNKDDQTKLFCAEVTPRKKFDYRVHKNPAPSWIRIGQSEPRGGPCACRPLHYPVSDMNRIKEREQEIQKWCQNLDYTLNKIDKWKELLNYISNYITMLKQKTEMEGRNTQNKRLINKTGDDTWRQINKRANKHFQLRRQDNEISPSPVRCCGWCGGIKPKQTKTHHHRTHSRRRLETMCKRHQHH